MKRTICSLLALVLLLGLLIPAANAAGDATVVWEENFSGASLEGGWFSFDGNWDGFGFDIHINKNEDPCEIISCVQSPRPIGDQTGQAKAADDYLITPVIELPNADREYGLSFDLDVDKKSEAEAELLWAVATSLEFYVVSADLDLDEDLFPSILSMPFAVENLPVTDDWTARKYDLSAYAGQKIRLVFRHLNTTGNFIALENFKITEYEPDQHLDLITIVDVPVPEVGKNAEDMDESQIRFPFAPALRVVPGSLEYYADESEDPVTGPFQSGVDYYVTFELEKPSEDFFLYKDAAVSVNGRGAYFAVGDYEIIVSQYLGAARPSSTPFRFDDVQDEKAFYYQPVYWAYFANPQVTKGVDATHFGPNQGCTRGQVVTFLWRAVGCPEPSGAATAFTDVKPGAFYEKAVAWAVEEGITKGVTDTTFAPDDTCTRGQIVTFLWRFCGEPKPDSTETGFTDVSATAYYAKAVAWAVQVDVTKGMTETTFAPNATCTRGQVVTFLFRTGK